MIYNLKRYCKWVFTDIIYIYRKRTDSLTLYYFESHISGTDPGFQARGGALKKCAQSEGRREHFWGVSCEKSRFYAKKSYFFQLRRETRKCFGYFV